MLITAKTKISQLIKYNKKSIDIIASINPHFRKLKNPVLRKLLAPRVNITDAARIGGITVDEFLQKLQQNGFEVDMNMHKSNQSPESADTKVKPIKMDRSNITDFTVAFDIHAITHEVNCIAIFCHFYLVGVFKIKNIFKLEGIASSCMAVKAGCCKQC